ncbi:MAG: Fur family transcriptional regulator [Candidatus Promineifilaceae bacterium]
MTNQLAKLGSSLKQEGYRLTQPRIHILEALVSCQGHITADDLYETIHSEQPGIARMSVYRTLDLLSELGLIRPVYQGTGAAHYILLDEGHHHHLVCSNCDKVIEFDDCVLQEIENSISSSYNFKIQGHVLEIFGRCADCQSTE